MAATPAAKPAAKKSPGGLAGLLDSIGSDLSAIAGIEGDAAQGYVTATAPAANVAGEQGANTAVNAGGSAAGATVSAAGATVGAIGSTFAALGTLAFWKGVGLVLAGVLIIVFAALELKRYV